MNMFLVAPDLVIEVLSPSNTMDEVLDRQNICLKNGCIAFWTVDPKRKSVMVTTADGKTITLRFVHEGAAAANDW